MEAQFQGWLTEKLSEIGLGDETYVQYVKDIVCMGSDISDDQEKLEGIIEFLSEAAVSHVEKRSQIGWRAC